MPLDFPSSPSLNQIHTFGTKSWSWNGYAWVSLGISGASASIDIQSTNSSSTFYPLFTSGTGNTAIYIDPTVTPFTYIPSSGTINARILGLSAPNGKINISSLTGILQTIFDTEILNWSTNPPELSHTGLLTFQLKSLIGLTLSSPIITFGNGINDLYTFPGYTGQTGNALLARENGQLYWGAVSNSIDTYVRTFNGRTGDVEGVTSINGLTGTITNVAFTNQGNTYSVRQIINAGISADGGLTLNGRLNSYSGISASLGITAAKLFVAGGGVTFIIPSGKLSIQKGTGTIPSTNLGDSSSIDLYYADTDSGNIINASIVPDPNTITATTQTLPAVSGTLLNTNTGVVSINGSSGIITNVARINEGNTFTIRQTINAGISAQGGMTLAGRFNFYSGICGGGGITLGSQVNAPIGISAGGITSDTGYKITSSAINTQTSSYTLTSGDNGKIITMNAGTGITLTVPTGLPVGHTTTIVRLGGGNVGISAANGVTINSFQNQVNIAGQHAAVSLISYSSNIFNLAGGLTG